MRLFCGIERLALNVNDIDVSISFYEKIGLELIEKDVTGNGKKRAVMRIGMQFLEFYETASQKVSHDSVPVNFFGHLSVQVENLRHTIESWLKKGLLIKRGSDVSSELVNMDNYNPIIGADCCVILWTVDPDGNPIEAMEQQNSLQQSWEKEHPFS